MTEQEYSEKLLAEAKEISFQMEVCLQDINWIGDKIKILHDKVVESPFEEREAAIKEMEFLTRKMNLNVATREAIRKKSQELGVRVNEFFGKKVWGTL